MTDSLAAFQSAVADRYAIEGRLGEGGMAIVFLANDLRHHRAVAVKVLRPEFAAVLGPDRFLREINFAAELNHPHIVPLFDSGVVPAGPGHPALPYYVMPRLEGETLRERIAREGALPIDEAVDIARQVAQALAYAHAQGIIHRDIKPANILLSDGEAVVADFGIARAVDRAGEGDRITDSGLTLGTPAYMAPEQTTGDSQLDGRADIYALGCVLYEMLGGSPPFSGATAAAVIARHRTDAPPSLLTLRSTVPPQLEAAVMRALAKSPADRFPTAANFARALSPGSGSMPAIQTSGGIPLAGIQRSRRHVILAVLAAVMLPLVVWGISQGGSSSAELASAALGYDSGLDTTRYAVTPFVYDSGITVELNEGQLIVDALGRWDGVTVIDPSQLRAAARPEAGALELSLSTARLAAASLEAARLIQGTVSAVPGGFHVSASLVETASGRVMARRSIRISPTLAGLDSAFTSLADGLLLRTDDGTAQAGGTMSLPARQAIRSGTSAIADWDLDRADTAFARALKFDEQSSEAAVWLAMTRSWNGAPVAAWRSLASRAEARPQGLSPRDLRILEAIRARADGDMVAACAAWRRLTAEAPSDFVGWYGSSDCQLSDAGVVRARRSPSGWRFRSSWNSGLAAYQKAFELRPAIHRALGRDAIGGLRRRFLTAATARRRGEAVAPDTGAFFGSPVWAGDSIALTPYRLSEIADAPLDADALIEGRRQLRHRLAETAMAWAAAYPASANAREVLAAALEMAGDPRSLDTLRAARARAATPEEAARLAAAEVWMRLRRRIPADADELRAVKALADSLLGRVEFEALDPMARASLAALTGHTTILARAAEAGWLRESFGVTPSLSPAAELLVVLSAMPAGPARLRDLEETLSTAIERTIPASHRDAERMQWIAYSAMLAFPEVRSTRLSALTGQGDHLVDAAAALAAGDSGASRRILASAKEARARLALAGVTMDALLAEAVLLAALGDTAGAVQLLDASFGALSHAGPGSLENPAKAAGFVRSAEYRATLARLQGDGTAERRWRSIAAVLRPGIDPTMRPSPSGGTP